MQIRTRLLLAGFACSIAAFAIAGGVNHLVPGKKILIKDNADTSKRKAVWLVKDAAVTGFPDPATYGAYVRDNADLLLTSAHPQGGNAVGAVVDEEFRVRGMENVFVCDASVFPSSVTVNPQLTVMGIAQYAARRITGQPARVVEQAPAPPGTQPGRAGTDSPQSIRR